MNQLYVVVEKPWENDERREDKQEIFSFFSKSPSYIGVFLNIKYIVSNPTIILLRSPKAMSLAEAQVCFSARARDSSAVTRL